MQPSIIAPKATVRPQVKRMTQKELRDTQASFEFDSTSLFQPSNQFSNRRQSQAVGESMVPWRPTDEQPQAAKNPDDNQCNLHRRWFYLFGVIFCFILIIAIVGIVLGIVLPMTTTAPSDQATRRLRFLNEETARPILCSNKDRGSIAFLNETSSSTWMYHSFNYSAIKIDSQLVFGFETNGNYTFYLDKISVVDNQTPSIQLLADLDSGNSSVNTTHWLTTCQTVCSINLISNSECFQGTGNCFTVQCPDSSSSIVFLSQYFETIIGHIYTISFVINHKGYSNDGKSSLYVDII